MSSFDYFAMGTIFMILAWHSYRIRKLENRINRMRLDPYSEDFYPHDN